ncbi:response regulator [Azospirillum sp. TSO22-1]|uniref:response regulator transcription factor n=1 Tax=Azospirillum sp. TSO22-1 TaxID=716789 RepID=UPI0011B6DA81|nr:response regulator [Azospirillum sp. TSO22-1]
MSHRFSDLDVFVVDDEQFSRSIITRMLRKVGIVNIRHAPDGQEALASLRWVRWTASSRTSTCRGSTVWNC